jgi:hypothetical protein
MTLKDLLMEARSVLCNSKKRLLLRITYLTWYKPSTIH